MKKKILKQMIIIGISATIAAFVLCTSVFYELFRENITSELRNYSKIIAEVSGDLKLDNYEVVDGMRVTIIDSNGNVYFDSNVNDSSVMENHKNRPEVKEALKTGEGSSERLSKTLDKTMFYYATKAENGSIVRVSKESSSFWGILISAMPIFIIVCVTISCICIYLSKTFTNKIVEPIDNLGKNLQNVSNMDIYPELIPFVNKIKEQHENIIKSSIIRQQFTANVSHELKTPLTAISGYADLIKNDIIPKENIPVYADKIKENSNRLLTLINDTIKLSELDDGGYEIKPELFNLTELSKRCIENLNFVAQKRNVKLHFIGNSSCMLFADESMVEEIIMNLCDNAIRYNKPNGSVYIELSQRMKGNVVLTVRDSGIGIPQESINHIFERFYRVDKSRSKSTGGTGLGLAIVKHIVSKHEAEIEISSEPNIGTRISVIFPYVDND